jgi:hypothetical protein
MRRLQLLDQVEQLDLGDDHGKGRLIHLFVGLLDLILMFINRGFDPREPRTWPLLTGFRPRLQASRNVGDGRARARSRPQMSRKACHALAPSGSPASSSAGSQRSSQETFVEAGTKAPQAALARSS